MSECPRWLGELMHNLGTFLKLHPLFEAVVVPVLYQLCYASRYLKGSDYIEYVILRTCELELAIQERTGQRPILHELRRDVAYFFGEIPNERGRELVWDWLRQRCPLEQDTKTAWVERKMGRFGWICRDVTEAEAAEFYRICDWQKETGRKTLFEGLLW